MKFCIRVFFILLVSLSCFSSCSEKQDYVVVDREFQNEEWNRFDFIISDFEVKKAPFVCDLVLEIKVSDVFPNIYPYHEEDYGLFTFNMTINNPNDDGFRSKGYSFFLKDKEGNWKSDLIDGYHTYTLPLINGMTFYESGFYKIKIENKYSKDPLYGIKSLSIKCVPAKI